MSWAEMSRVYPHAWFEFSHTHVMGSGINTSRNWSASLQCAVALCLALGGLYYFDLEVTQNRVKCPYSCSTVYLPVDIDEHPNSWRLSVCVSNSHFENIKAKDWTSHCALK